MNILHGSLRVAVLLSATCHALALPALPDSDDTGSYPAPTGYNHRRDAYTTRDVSENATCSCRHRHHHHHDDEDTDGDTVKSVSTVTVPVTVYQNGTHYSTQTRASATGSATTTDDSEPLWGVISMPAPATPNLSPAESTTTSVLTSTDSAQAAPALASSPSQQQAPASTSSTSTTSTQPVPTSASTSMTTQETTSASASSAIMPNKQTDPSQEQPPSPPPPILAPPNQNPPPSQQPPSPPPNQSAIPQSQAQASESPPPSQPPATQAAATSQAASTGQVAATNQAIPPSQALASEIPQSQAPATQAASTKQAIPQSQAQASEIPATQAATTSQAAPAVTPSSATTAAAAPTPASSGNSSIPFLRGVNIGNWLIVEKWMDPTLWTGDTANAVDQWTFDSTPNAAAALQQHWSTWFTASDAKTLASYGINALRIPIGYWAYDNTGTPFIEGADHYLELAIQWAREFNMKVWVDLHGSPGSQNGQDHSGHKGKMLWQQGDNLNRSTAVLVTIAKKYGSAMYADVVVGIEIVNEPAFSGNVSFKTSQAWSKDAYRAMKAVTTNPNLVIVTHDSFQGTTTFIDIAKDLGAPDFGVDAHEYQLYTDADNTLTQAQHIAKACSWAKDLATTKAAMPVYIGEWSALTNVCVNADGSTTPGTSCASSGCQCVTAEPKTWNAKTVEQVRRYVEAQLDVWETSTMGWFLWGFGGPGGWGIGNLVEAGVMPSPVTERKYPGQCG